MKKFYPGILFLLLNLLWAQFLIAQNCQLLTATIKTNESRCAATGSIEIIPSGGTGSYKYKVEGPVKTDYTTSNSITGLSAGIYTVTVNDIVSNCSYTKNGVTVTGSYEDPRFGLEGIDVSCDNGKNGSIKVTGVQRGMAPFNYSIVAPSPAGVGTTNTSGIFQNLVAGDYSIQLRDSCGGIQTRTVTINNYTWKIDSHTFTKFSCDSAAGTIKASDSKGNVSTVQGISGFQYGFIKPNGDTIWSAKPDLRIGANRISSVDLVVKDVCGKVKKITAPLSFIPSLNNNVTISNKACNSFTAAVTGIKNFTNPVFSLYDNNNTLIKSNNTGIFTGLSYGKNYCIRVFDECSGTTISRCFVEQASPIFINQNVIISNKNCTTFDAKATGLTGFTNPNFILLKDGNIIGNNTTGEFKNLAYGNYCMVSRDGCRDTSITQCFNVKPPVPKIDPVIIPSYVNCVDFGIAVGGDSLTLPTYCLFDTANVKINCNNTGIFNNIPLGSYCVTIHDACMDTTIVRCFSVGPPTIPNDVAINIINKSCNDFTASVATHHFLNAAYCLYNANDDLIRCDSSGIFNNLAYGTYYIFSKNFCPDTTVTTHFSATPPIPRINTAVTMSNNTCNTFTAKVTGQLNLTNPEYFLLDKDNQVIASNKTGTFNNILFGSYCIRVVNQCYDTTMKVCFSNTVNPLTLTATAARSCNYGTSKFTIKTTGNFPANIKILTPGNILIYDKTTSATSITVDDIPDLEAGKLYTIIVKDNCGNEKTLTLAPVIGYLNHSVSVTNKCPGSLWANGSGNIHSTVTTNTGVITVRIIKKDLVPLSPILNPSSTSGSTYSFNDFGPGSYIVRYNTNDGCNVFKYDTVIVRPYAYPELTKSSAYQCDVNGFSVGAVVSDGVGPFSYSIIGSLPETPVIISTPQAGPVFNIDNGNTYSLIRLRALDACGNATLGDASILPLANNKIIPSSNCFDYPVELSIDGMYNTTAIWYKKKNIEDADSILVGSGFNFLIEKLVDRDTGIYICHLKVNSGCIERIYYIRINGSCYSALPVNMTNLEGKFEKEEVFLNWNLTNGKELKTILIQRRSPDNFRTIGEVIPTSIDGVNKYRFIDPEPENQNYYRLQLIHKNNQVTYSNIVLLRKMELKGINIYPNPVSDVINIDFIKRDLKTYHISLANVLNQKVKEIKFLNNGEKLLIHRTKEMTSGMYVIQILNSETNEEFSQKIILK